MRGHARTGRPEVESSQMVVAPNGELRTRAEPGTGGDAWQAGGVVKVSGTPTHELEVGLAERRLQLEEGPWEVEVSAEDAQGLLDQLAAAPDLQVLFGFAEGDDGEAEGAAGALTSGGGSGRSAVPGKVNGRLASLACTRAPRSDLEYKACRARGRKGANKRRLGADAPRGSAAEGSFWLRALPAGADAGSEGGELQRQARRGRRIEFGWSLDAREETYVLHIWREEAAGCAGPSLVPGDGNNRQNIVADNNDELLESTSKPGPVRPGS